MTAEIQAQLVCVVSDDAVVREEMGNSLRDAGLRVYTFSSTRDFLEQEPADEPSCLVVDVRRPVSDGLSLMKRERARTGNATPVLFLTSSQDISSSLRALRRGATEFLVKPVAAELLLEAVRRFSGDGNPAARVPGHQEELAAAAQIQQGLMALTIPQSPFASVTGRNLPCAAIGGDFFTALMVDDSIIVVIADVAGKGIAAAVMASALQGMIHEGLRYRIPLSEIARDANEFFAGRDLGSRYATCVIASLSPEGVLEYMNCGHVTPIVVRGGAVHGGAVRDGEVIKLGETNLPIGLLPDAEFRSSVFAMKPADRLILVTDGITEAEAEAGAFFGFDRFSALAREGMATDQIFNAVLEFCGEKPMADDCTIIGVDFTGPARS